MLYRPACKAELMPLNSPVGVEVEPLAPHLGARVSGLKLGARMSDESFAALRALLDRYHVLALPNQELEPETLRAVTARFGPLFDHHADEGVLKVDGVPEVLEMRKEPDGTRLFGGSDWHADVTFRSPCGLVSILHARIIPSIGGDTGFASSVAAFSALSPGLQRLLQRMRAVHS